MVSNLEFLTAIFGDEYHRSHVTSFNDDPSNIPQENRGRCWAGHHFADRSLTGLNQYYTVSLFTPHLDPTSGKLKKTRRKASFEAIYIICLDDVKEKLDLDEALKLPEPSFILETSHGSEQWGYILNEPCTDANKADNLLDGLVSEGLAPDGVDPGMKGVTRYVRLPEGKNNKASKQVFGRPFNCRILSWNPDNKHALEDIAAPFSIDLYADRRSVAVDGAIDNDHPVLNKVHINEKLSPGRYDIKCPWVDDHTAKANDGAAVFTNEDGSLGFKCWHGHCLTRNATDLIRYYDLNKEINDWKIKDLLNKNLPATNAAPVKAEVVADVTPADQLVDMLEHMVFGTERNELAQEILMTVRDFDAITKLDIHKRVKSIMDWNSAEFKMVLKDLMKPKKKEYDDTHFYQEYVFVNEQNKFYHPIKKMWHSPEAFTNIHFHDDQEARKQALMGAVTKVDKIDYWPENGPVFEENGIQYANIWREREIPRMEGDVTPWLDHFKLLGWDAEHIINWMAFTVQYPGTKINHGLILGGAEGTGKDWLLTPLKKAMGADHQTIEGDELLKDYNNYIVGTKYLHINEVELGDNKDALRISNKVKPMLARPPETLRVREMYAGAYDVRNIVNVSMSSNSRMPLRLREVSRRLYCLWSDFRIKDSKGMTKPEWIEYWRKQWAWMENGGWQKCVNYLMEWDLSNFNPGASPPATEWLRDMVSGSENSVVQTLKVLIDKRYDTFNGGMVTTNDIMSTISMAKRVMPEYIFCDRITPSMVELNLKNMGYIKENGFWVISDESLRLVNR